MFSVDLLPDRMRSKIAVNPESGCWLWTASRLPRGYGMVTYRKVRTYSHRLAWELLVGPIPDGLTIDHLCKVTSCCNPAHLEVVTMGVNSLRGDSPIARNARKTHCDRGHELAGDNLWVRDRGTYTARECLACRKVRNDRHNALRARRS